MNLQQETRPVDWYEDGTKWGDSSGGNATGVLEPPRVRYQNEDDNIDFQRLERVLVVDDDTELNRALTRRLTRAGLQVSSALDGWNALDIYRRLDPDAVVLDLNMPGLDGFKFLHFLRHTPGMVQVPIVVITGRAEKGLEERLEPMGVNRVLYKPLSLKRVVAEVVNAIEGV